jgi:ribosome-associated protein
MSAISSLQLKKLVTDVLDEHKAEAIAALDVRHLTDVADYMVICSATSARHVKALASHLAEQLKYQHGVKALGVEWEEGGDEWALVDFGDVIVNIMVPQVRAFYDLDKLWDIPLSSVAGEAKSAPKSKKKAPRKKVQKSVKARVQSVAKKSNRSKTKVVVRKSKVGTGSKQMVKTKRVKAK